MDRIRIAALVADDAFAASCQTLGQYRTALLAALRDSPAPVGEWLNLNPESAAPEIDNGGAPSEGPERCPKCNDTGSYVGEVGSMICDCRDLFTNMGRGLQHLAPLIDAGRAPAPEQRTTGETHEAVVSAFADYLSGKFDDDNRAAVEVRCRGMAEYLLNLRERIIEHAALRGTQSLPAELTNQDASEDANQEARRNPCPHPDPELQWVCERCGDRWAPDEDMLVRIGVLEAEVEELRALRGTQEASGENESMAIRALRHDPTADEWGVLTANILRNWSPDSMVHLRDVLANRTPETTNG